MADTEMMTRSKMRLSNWTNLPVELISFILSSFSFRDVVKTSEVNKSMSMNVDFIMRYINAINDKISVKTIEYVVNKCKAIKSPPYICGATDYDIYSMRKVLKKWPDYLHLNWDMTSSNTISTFLRSVSTSSFRQINHMSLKVDMTRFSATKMNLHYMDLKSLTVEGEGCDLRDIIIGLNCRCWDVDELYLRGDVTDLGSLMMYAPAVSSKITIINTNDNINILTMGTDQGLRYLTSAIKNVHLCNIIKYCCDPPHTCTMVDLFVSAITTSLFVPRDGIWTVDRLNVDMIEALVVNGIQVICGVFKSELKRLKVLELEHPQKIVVTSVL